VDEIISRLRDSLVGREVPLVDADSTDADSPACQREFWVSDTFFRATDRYISARVKIYAYNGGAHGMTYFHAFNYDTRAGEFMDNARLLDYTRKADVEKLLDARLDNPDGCFTDRPRLGNSTAVNFSAGEMIFTYPPYALGPYSCGAAEIVVPLKELGKAVKARL
jgi:hypothetical protein